MGGCYEDNIFSGWNLNTQMTDCPKVIDTVDQIEYRDNGASQYIRKIRGWGVGGQTIGVR